MKNKPAKTKKAAKQRKKQKPKKAEIYALCDPETGEVRYIGKSSDSHHRFKSHMRETRRDYPLYRWINKLRKSGLCPKLKILFETDDWEISEKLTIEKYRQSGRLLNVAEGGDQPYCSLETRQKNGKIRAIARVSTPEKARLWEIKQQLGILLKQGYVSEKTKEKMRYAATRKPELFGEWLYV